MIKGAIFDLDGTLIDSMPMWTSLAEDFLRELGKEPEENLTYKFKTMTLAESAQYYIDNYGVEYSVKEIIDMVQKRIAEFYVEKVPVKDGVKSFLESLKQSGMKMCIATVTPCALARPALQRLGLLDYFTCVYSASDVGMNKENPEFFRRVSEDFGLAQKETAVFEDSYHSLKTANSLGYYCVAVFDRCETKQEELKSVCNLYLNDLTDFEIFRCNVETGF